MSAACLNPPLNVAENKSLTHICYFNGYRPSLPSLSLPTRIPTYSTTRYLKTRARTLPATIAFQQKIQMYILHLGGI